MKKNIVKWMNNALLLMLLLACSSCLDGNMDDLPAFEEANITDVKFDFRYKDPSDVWIDGEPIVKVVTLTVENKFNLSTAAVIAPQDGAPTLGVPGDFSTTRRYLVTAANGTKKDWTIQVTALNK